MVNIPSTYSVEDIFIHVYSVQKIKMTCKYVKGTVWYLKQLISIYEISCVKIIIERSFRHKYTIMQIGA